MNFRKFVRKNLVNIPGWSTRRRIVVIESDDWGSIRMHSKKAYNLMLAMGIPVDSHYFLKNDSLESEQDMAELFEVLSAIKDMNGNHPVITANAVVANPAFDRIEAGKMKEYYYEPVSETYKRYPNHNRTLDLWRNEGMANGLLRPQFHGREHLNVRMWMNAVSSADPWERAAFENNVLLGLGHGGSSNHRYNYMAAFAYTSGSEWDDLSLIAREGLNLFERLFGFRSRSFVAPCSVRGDHLDSTLRNSGILYHQCGQQLIPDSQGSVRVKNRFWGQTNYLGQVYWRRNSTFEPSRKPDFDWVDSCLAEMTIAFRWGKPAVINSHRVNYMGSISQANRDNTLRLLRRLIKEILKRWPDAEFMSSDKLGDLILSCQPRESKIGFTENQEKM